MKYIAFIFAFIAINCILPFVALPSPLAPSAYGTMLVVAGYAGFAIGSVLIGCVGLLYRKNRFSGFVLVTLAASIVAQFRIGPAILSPDHARTGVTLLGLSVFAVAIFTLMGWRAISAKGSSEKMAWDAATAASMLLVSVAWLVIANSD